MSVVFTYTPIMNVKTYCGLESDLTQQVPKVLRKGGEAYNNALKQLKDDFQQYRNDLLKSYSYAHFVKEVKLSEYECLASEVLPAVLEKFKQQNGEKLQEEREKFSFVHKIFHRIAGLFKGRGFRTEGEWGNAVMQGLQNGRLSWYKSKMKAVFTNMGSVSNRNEAKKVVADLIKQIDDFSDDQLRVLLRGFF